MKDGSVNINYVTWRSPDRAFWLATRYKLVGGSWSAGELINAVTDWLMDIKQKTVIFPPLHFTHTLHEKLLQNKGLFSFLSFN